MIMRVDPNYCMSSYLALRFIEDEDIWFKKDLPHPLHRPVPPEEQMVCNTAQEIHRGIGKLLEGKLDDPGSLGIMLSGGADSAIVASYMPRGARAYTARCSAPGAVDETARAAEIARRCGLEHIVVEVSWEDYLRLSPELMRHDGSPIHANEPQVYKLARRAVEDGIRLMIFGDNADMAFGGYDQLLSRDWTYEEWKKRYTYVDPAAVLREPVDMDYLFERYRSDAPWFNGVDYISFMNDIFAVSSTGSYTNAFRLAGLAYFDPYAYMRMDQPGVPTPYDLERIRAGESKYLIRELFFRRYPDLPWPEKIAMARAMDQWMKDWQGPERPEFLPLRGKMDRFTGEQKWQIFNLEWFLNLMEE
jgi:asparagine synthetase B (glutamine-hydrolysing)